MSFRERLRFHLWAFTHWPCTNPFSRNSMFGLLYRDGIGGWVYCNGCGRTFFSPAPKEGGAG